MMRAAVAWRAVIRHMPLLTLDFRTRPSTLSVMLMTSTFLAVDIVSLSRRAFRVFSTSNYNAQSADINSGIKTFKNASPYLTAKGL